MLFIQGDRGKSLTSGFQQRRASRREIVQDNKKITMMMTSPPPPIHFKDRCYIKNARNYVRDRGKKALTMIPLHSNLFLSFISLDFLNVSRRRLVVVDWQCPGP